MVIKIDKKILNRESSMENLKRKPTLLQAKNVLKGNYKNSLTGRDRIKKRFNRI